jgi:hypothetical protein
MQSLIRLKGRCMSFKVDGAGEGEGLKLDHISKDTGKRSMYGESQLYLSMAAAVTGVECAASLPHS